MLHRTSTKRLQPSVSTLRLSSIRKLLEDRRGAGIAGATLVAEEERCFRGALPSILEPRGRPVGLGLAVSWVELWCPALLADRGVAWVEELAAQHLARPRHLKADALGHLLGLTSEERTRLRITTIGAVGQTRRKRVTDRKAKARERMMAARAKAGAVPRGLSIEALAPWSLEGMTKPTWYRRYSKAEREAKIEHLRRIRAQQDLRSETGGNEFVSRQNREGVSLKENPASRATRSIVEDIGSLPLSALAAMEILRSRSFGEATL